MPRIGPEKYARHIRYHCMPKKDSVTGENYKRGITYWYEIADIPT